MALKIFSIKKKISVSHSLGTSRLNDGPDIRGTPHSNERQCPAGDFGFSSVGRTRLPADVGLDSIVSCWWLGGDPNALSNFRRFRDDVPGTPLRHGLDVFDPEIDVGPESRDCRIIAVREAGSPVLQGREQSHEIPFNGPRATEEMCSHGPGHPVDGGLCGSAGTESGPTIARTIRSFDPWPRPFGGLPVLPIRRTVETRLLVGNDTGLERFR